MKSNLLNKTVRIPEPPNFLKVGNQMIEIANFTVKELKEIGRIYTENLLEKRCRGVIS